MIADFHVTFDALDDDNIIVNGYNYEDFEKISKVTKNLDNSFLKNAFNKVGVDYPNCEDKVIYTEGYICNGCLRFKIALDVDNINKEKIKCFKHFLEKTEIPFNASFTVKLDDIRD